MHSSQNYSSQRNQDNKNFGSNKNKETVRGEQNLYGSSKLKTTTNLLQEKNCENSNSVKIDNEKENSSIYSKSTTFNMNEKIFAAKCTISEKNSSITDKLTGNCSSKENKNEKDTNSNENETLTYESESSSQLNSTVNFTINTKTNNNSMKTNVSTPNLTSQNNSSNISKFGIPVPNRIFVGGISTDTTESELQSLFSQFGVINAVKIIIDREGVPKGYGFITFESEEEANKVLKESDNLFLKNRKLNVAIAVKKQSPNTSFTNSNRTPRNLNHYLQNSNMFYLPNGINSIPAYMSEYPISFPADTLYAYASPHLTNLTHSNQPGFSPYPPLLYRPSSIYFPSSNISLSHQSSNQNNSYIPINNVCQTNSQQNQQQPQQHHQGQSHHHPSNRINTKNNNNSSNTENSGHPLNAQFHSHTNSGHTNNHQQIHGHSHNHHGQLNYRSNMTNTNSGNQQHLPVFINTGGMPYIHPLSLQYNHGIAPAMSNVGPMPTFTANTTQLQNSLSHQNQYSHNLNPLSTQHSQPLNQFSIMPSNWISGSQWRYHNASN